MELNTALAQLAQDPTAPLDVAELALQLARDEYPDVDVEAYLCELAGMAHEARPLLRGSLETRVKGLCRYLFHEMGFRGNVQEYYDPRNSYLSQVLDRRTGIPITLSVVALAVGTRAGLPIVGVGLPGHFVVKAVAEGREVLFDPFHGGRLLTPTDCEHLVHQVTGLAFAADRTTLTAVPVGQILMRMLNNLKAVYLGQKDFVRAVRVIERLRQLDPADALQRRDLGISLLHADQPGRAINHLQAYLAARPDDAEAETVRQMLEQARGAVARWN
ncbi:MAG: tetratricopeptide repeat protein [Gemmataceae bacterium]|nr:tetratricopeptide repeat protein [Gemmataceae bacterium]